MTPLRFNLTGDPVPPHRLAHEFSVHLAEDSVTVTASPEMFARVGGRKVFGSPAEAREGLLDAIAAAWYAADCP